MASRSKGHSGSYFLGQNTLISSSKRSLNNKASSRKPTPTKSSSIYQLPNIDSINSDFFENLVSSTNHLKHIISDLKSLKTRRNQEKKASLLALRQEISALASLIN